MEGDETVSEIHVKRQVLDDVAEAEGKNPETKSLEQLKNEEKEAENVEDRDGGSSETEMKHEEIEEQSSPRGVLEIPISGSDSDRSSSIDRSSSFGSEKSLVERGVVAGELSNGNLHWKKLFGQIKRTSVMKFWTISLLNGHGNRVGFGPELSKKTMKKKLWRNRSAEDATNCGDIVMPKPTWRNFSYEELKQATNDFSSDKLIGKGGHAHVFRGCLSDGQVVAVKKITKEKKK